MARLFELADAVSNRRFVVHADLINRNVLVESGRINAVFDWGGVAVTARTLAYVE